MQKSKLRYVHVAIILLFMFGFRYLPTFGTVTPLGMQTLGIFIGIIYGWSTMDLIWPSLLGLAALSLLPGNSAITVFQTGFGDRLTLGVFFFLLLGELVNKVGLSKFIADWCVSRKFIVGKPYGILAMFCAAGAFLAAFVNVFAGMILMWGIFYSFCKEANLQPGDSYARVSLIAIIFVCAVASGLLPFMNMGFVVNSIQAQMFGVAMPYISYSIMQFIMIVLAVIIYFAFIILVIRPDTSVVKNYVPSNTKLVMNNQQKFVFGLLMCLMVVLFLPGLLPAELIITKILKALDISGVAGLAFVTYFVVNLNNENAVSFEEIAKDVNWSLILMFAAVAPLTTAISNNDAGIMPYLNVILSNVFGDMNPTLFVILIILFASIITQFCNNVAIVLLIAPLAYTFALQLGLNINVLGVLMAFNLNIAFCTPAASGPAAIIFSNQTWIGTKESFKHGIVIFIINMLVTIIGLFIGGLIL